MFINKVVFLNDDNNIVIENTTFSNIKLKSERAYNLFSLSNLHGNACFKNSNFTEINSFGNLFMIETLQHFLIEGVNFIKNDVFFFLVNVKNVFNLTMKNTLSWFTNNGKGTYYNNGGGSFRIYNTNYKTFINLQISYGFSVKTAFGLIIIDDLYRKTSELTQFSV